jgi:lipoprotein-releasing system permease protein
MFKPYSLFIGTRYAIEKRQSHLVSFISSISVMGMALGVALLIVVLSVMNGFDREMRNRILGLVPHITITSYQYVSPLTNESKGSSEQWADISTKILSHPEVEAVAPFTQLNAMLLIGTEVEGIAVYGIDPEQESKVSIITDYIESSALIALKDSSSIIIGEALADRLSLAVGDAVNLMIPSETVSGRINPKFARFTIVDIFNTGTEIDQSITLIGLDQSLTLMPEDKKTQALRVKLTDTFQAERVAWEIGQNLPYGYSTSDWTRSYGNLYSAIQLSKQLVGLMLFTIIAVAAFNVVSALVMIVTDKRGDIAILRTAGASPNSIMLIFMVQGTLIAVMGAGLGALLGCLLSLFVTDIISVIESIFSVHFLNSDVYPIDYLPSDLRIKDVVVVCSTAFLMSLLATVYPAWRASRVQPAEALRYQ